MRTTILIVAIFALACFGCEREIYYAQIDRFFLKLERQETVHPNWLHNSCFIMVDAPRRDSLRINCPVLYTTSILVFYPNNTFERYGFIHYCGETLPDKILHDSIDVFLSKRTRFAPHFKLDPDTLMKVSTGYLQSGGIYYVNHDTIICSQLERGDLIGRIIGEGGFDRRLLKIDTVNKSIFISIPDMSYQALSYNRIKSTGQTRFVGPFKPYIATIPPFNVNQAINYWHPFRKWKARLDSINAGLRPPEVYVPR